MSGRVPGCRRLHKQPSRKQGAEQTTDDAYGHLHDPPHSCIHITLWSFGRPPSGGTQGLSLDGAVERRVGIGPDRWWCTRAEDVFAHRRVTERVPAVDEPFLLGI